MSVLACRERTDRSAIGDKQRRHERTRARARAQRTRGRAWQRSGGVPVRPCVRRGVRLCPRARVSAPSVRAPREPPAALACAMPRRPVVP